MPTSSRFAVAVHILTALTVHQDRTVRSQELASSANTNPAVVRRILSRLAKVGITTARLGVGGGARLAKPPGDITLLDVFRAVEESDLFAWHRSIPDKNCVVGRNIQSALRPAMDRAQQAMESELERVTIDQVARRIAARAKIKIPFLPTKRATI